ncbi:MAG: hypothetical protein JWM91_364 [Rhodospirillales bacterium]|nr:hypothetical protein [Rhodospirillales bacterium]
MMHIRPLGVFLLLLGLTGCATHQAVTGPAQAAAAPSASSQRLPPDVRPDLSGQWVLPTGAIRWPPDDGFAGAPTPVVLSQGMLIDRFGSDGGRFFSPKGAAYPARALPYTCEKLAYITYRVTQPLLVWTGKAAAWFDAPGGATQFQTDAPAYLLISDHIIEAVPHPGARPCG